MASVGNTVSAKQRVVQLNQHVTITLEEFTHTDNTRRERPILAEAKKVGDFTSVRDNDYVPIALRYTLADGQIGQDPRPKDTEFGHLIALHLGGKDMNAYENLVPMNAGINQNGDWRQRERDLLDKRKVIKSITIAISYANSDGRIPSGFTFDVREGKRKKSGWLSRSITNPAYATPTTVKRDVSFINAYYKAMSTFAGSGFTMQGYATKEKRNFGSIPNPPGPYAILDYMWVEDLIEHPKNFTGGSAFTKEQRHYILQVNSLQNRGVLKSDDPNDTEQGALSKEGNDTAPQVDHIKAKYGQNGSNAYSNAQVLSGKHNKHLTNKPTKMDAATQSAWDSLTTTSSSNNGGPAMNLRSTSSSSSNNSSNNAPSACSSNSTMDVQGT
jgi:5-methylcytosine-specific restriction endonuclease McrA